MSLKGSGHHVVSMITELFTCGQINVLVGTKSLLGEGWDSPCINSLILATYVGSFMLSNQMRVEEVEEVDKKILEPGYIFFNAVVMEVVSVILFILSVMARALGSASAETAFLPGIIIYIVISAACMRKAIGPYEAVYTRNPEGRRLLLKARTKSFVNKNDKILHGKKRVKGEFE